MMDEQHMSAGLLGKPLGVADGSRHIARRVLIPIPDAQVEGVKDDQHPLSLPLPLEVERLAYEPPHLRFVRQVDG